MPVPYNKPHILLSRNSIVLRPQIYEHLKKVKRVELVYNEKKQIVTITPTQATGRNTGRPGQKFIYNIQHLRHPSIPAERFARIHGISISIYSRPHRFKAKWNEASKTVTVFMKEGTEETGHESAMSRAKRGRRHAKT